jgi:hypothetical protein
MFRRVLVSVALCSLCAFAENSSDELTLKIKRCSLPSVENEVVKNDLKSIVEQIKSSKNDGEIKALKSEARALRAVCLNDSI